MNGEIFYSLREAQILIEQWRIHYNTPSQDISCGNTLPGSGQAAQRTALSPACTGKHRSDGPEADDALTIKPDHQMGTRHIPVFDKSERNDGTWTRADFEWDAENDQYICPEGHELKQFRRNYSDPNRGPTGKGTARYRALKEVCQACPSRGQCCPNADARKITREEHEDARQVARDIAKTDQYVISMKLRKKVEMLFAHLKRILRLDRLRLRGPNGARDEFLLAATAQTRRKLAKLVPTAPAPA